MILIMSNNWSENLFLIIFHAKQKVFLEYIPSMYSDDIYQVVFLNSHLWNNLRK